MQTRRQFVAAAGTAAAAAVLAPEALGRGRAAPLARGGRFAEGVMSGEPTPRGITLWTRLGDVGGRVSADLEIARDRDFRRVVARRRVTTSGDRAHNLKARVTGLSPHEQYYYRFSTRTTDGPVGRFRTALPADSRQPVRFAFWSCQDYTHGFYNAHDVMADDDLDFVLCLGDYIYAETEETGATAVRADRIGSTGPTGQRAATTLDDYRAKYRLYRSDASLRRLHARFPTVMLWDDHEVQDNYAGGERDGGLPPQLRYSLARKRAAYKAFFESMPYSPPMGNRIYRTLRFGRTVDLIVMDQRQYRANQPCNDAIAPACPELFAPRAFLGQAQMDFVKNELRSSPAAWKVMANEVIMMPVKLPNNAFAMFDSWQGYPVEREQLLQFIKSNGIADVVFVTGDIHTFIAGDVRTNLGAGEPVAVEFVGGSITSKGIGEGEAGLLPGGNDRHPNTPPGVVNLLRSLNPWADQADLDHHGYARVTATQDRFDCEFVRMQTIKRRSRATLSPNGFRYSVARGQRSIKGVNGPAA
ncbi:MAG: alkaline phosphatase [Solirubrobacteraceae bacterium]|nr:alkaline phosphatase [Solirubrobacteraceae bacterium]